jgi:hypothetical protein
VREESSATLVSQSIVAAPDTVTPRRTSDIALMFPYAQPDAVAAHVPSLPHPYPIQFELIPPEFGFPWFGPGGCGVVKNSVFPGIPLVGTAGFVFGTQADVKPPPVPWHPVAHRDAISTQLAFLRAGDPTCPGVPAQPEQATSPVSTTVNNTRNRPCIWSYRTLAFDISQLELDRGKVGHISFSAASPSHTSRNCRDVGGK